MTTETEDASQTTQEIRQETYTMAFYVAVCLIAALAAIEEQDSRVVLSVIWGTTVGLALAHLFAFGLATRLVGSVRGEIGGRLAGAQLVGALVVALFATIPVLVFDGSAGVDGARLVVSALIGGAAFAIGRSSGASTLRSAVFAAGVLAVATTVAVVKNYLLGH